MRYSIKELAKIFSVSIRTLHWYDEIGLLKPASYQESGYRIYEEPQLLLFQQILFFRELGFKIKEIKELLASTECEKITALSTKKESLEVTVKRLKNLIHTIDRTMLKIKNDTPHAYKGFTLDTYLGAEDANIDGEANDSFDTTLYRALELCLFQGLEPGSPKVQRLIHEHYKIAELFFNTNMEIYASLAQLYCVHPHFRNFFLPHEPKLIEFMGQAMRLYVQKDLS